MHNVAGYLELRCLGYDVEVWQLFRCCLERIGCRGVPLDFARDLASKFPSAVRKFATDVGGDKLNSNRIVGPRHNLKPGELRIVRSSWEGEKRMQLTISAYLALGPTKLSNDGFTYRRYLSTDFSNEHSPSREGDELVEDTLDASAALRNVTLDPSRKHEVGIALYKNLDCSVQCATG